MFHLCYFVRGGYYYYSNGNLLNRGSNGLYWESRVGSAANAYYLPFDSTYLLPQGNYDYRKGYGFSARCVAR